MNTSLMMSNWGKRVGKALMKSKSKFKEETDTSRWNIVRGDQVKVMQGPQAGQQGKVLQVLRKDNRILIEGVNIRRRMVKPLMDGTPGKVINRPCTVHYSNVMLIDPSTGQTAKVARRYLEDGTKVRVCKKTGNIIPKPDPLFDRKPRSVVVGPKDTPSEDVMEVTFDGYKDYLPYIYASERKGAAPTASS